MIGPDFKFTQVVLEGNDNKQIFCKEPDYKKWLTLLQLRRMSKPVRMSVAAAIECLQGSKPDSIHVGTAFGILYDTEIFLRDTILQEEQMLSPTSFIQSTHNTVAGAIALSIESNAHNMTFVHKAHSFENAFLDGFLLLEEHPQNQILVGAVEELTEKSYDILQKFDVYKGNVFGGEGTAFFSISGNKTENSIAKIRYFEMWKSNSKSEVLNIINRLLNDKRLDFAQNDAVVIGAMNDQKSQNTHAYLKENLYPKNECFEFKHLCGEYPVASSFGLAYATHLLKDNADKRCWLINNYGSYWSIWLLEGKDIS